MHAYNTIQNRETQTYTHSYVHTTSMPSPHPHFLLVTFPAQGQINPALQLAKRLLRLGARVTYATAVSTLRYMTPTAPPLDGLTFAAFSDGYDDGFNSTNDDEVKLYTSLLKCQGSKTLNHLIVDSQKEGRPVTCLIYTLLLPWAAEVARALQIPSVLLWIQPAMVLDIYFYYFNGYGNVITESANANDPSCLINLPGLPPLTSRDLPSFLIPPYNYPFALPAFQEQIETLDLETSPTILVNTFDALEPEALRAVDRFKMVAIGPLIPSAFLDGEDPGDTSFGGDIFHGRNSNDHHYKEWLNSKPESSVVYVSFGTVALLKKPQMEELARGLIDSGHPFLWVIREKENGDQEEKLSCMEELEQQGMIVTWCSQVEVLSHPAVGCFVTHCGWNSTLESLVSGMAVVAYPQWSDQGTNAKLIEEEWKTGVRVKLNQQGVAEREEIKRCLQVVMGTEDFRGNANKWKDLARQAAKYGGSSYNNLKAFVDEFQPCFTTNQ